MDNALKDFEVKAMERDEDRFYYVAGYRFEKDRKYTVEDYEALPENVRVELIDGVFYELYPKAEAPLTIHQRVVMELSYRIRRFIDEKDGSCEVFPAPFAVRVNNDDKTSVEPDISVICDPSKISRKGCEGAPDWVIEVISPGTEKHDHITKTSLYITAGVREYWIVDPHKEKIVVYQFDSDGPLPNVYTFKDTVKAGIYEDLYIDFSEIKCP